MTAIYLHLYTKHTWDISEGFGDTAVLVVDDAWPSALDTSAVPHLTLTGTHALGSVDLRKECTHLNTLIKPEKPKKETLMAGDILLENDKLPS